MIRTRTCVRCALVSLAFVVMLGCGAKESADANRGEVGSRVEGADSAEASSAVLSVAGDSAAAEDNGSSGVGVRLGPRLNAPALGSQSSSTKSSGPRLKMPAPPADDKK
ncbi:MAG: hypothetical protein GF331_13625 [Chitinivibrionales bacterium]|nr:hypothetical protein [Chitinivibrionales bacterium]